MNNYLLNNKNIFKTSMIGFLIVSLSGCGSLFSGAGPLKSNIVNQSSKHDGGYQLITLSENNIAAYMRPKPAILRPTVTKTTLPLTTLMVGDILSIMIADDVDNGGLFASLASGGTVFDKVRVDAKGDISLPYIDALNISGLTVTEANAKIKATIKKYTVNPQVYITVMSEMGASVLVTGDVNKPGRFSTLQGPLTVLDAITQAGGPKLEPYLVDVVVRNGRSVQKFNYEELLSGYNFMVIPNSEIVIERARKRFVAMGAVNKTGIHDFPSMNPSLLEVLGSVGGLNEQKADVRGVFVFRINEYSEPKIAEVFQLDMQKPVSMFIAKQFLIQPEDAIYVTNASVYEFQKMITPIVQVLVLGGTINNLAD